MYRSACCLALLVAACGVSSDPAPVATAREAATAATGLLAASREHVIGDIYHYSFDVRVGDTPNAVLRMHRVVRERAPWLPRTTRGGILALHGDFSTFLTNFAPTLASPASPAAGLAPWLAARDIDVWGFDRRWTHPGVDGDTSDFGDMGVAQEIGDIRTALSVARAVRLVTGSGYGRLTLVGYSHGAELAYLYASDEAKLAPSQRQIKGLVPLDIYATIAPEDEGLRQFACANAAIERDALAQGVTDADNLFLIDVGNLARTDPDGPSPYFEGATNRDVLFLLAAQTYFFVPFTPFYHLIAGNIVGGVVTGFRESPEDAVSAWFAGASPHQSMREVADLDSIWCNEPPLPVDFSPARITVPLLYIGTAGGFGDHGLYTTTLVGSTDVTTLVIRQLPPEEEDQDFGHGDLMYGADAPDLAWAPLYAWLLVH